MFQTIKSQVGEVCHKYMINNPGNIVNKRLLLFTGLDYWTGTLDWTTGIQLYYVILIIVKARVCACMHAAILLL